MLIGLIGPIGPIGAVACGRPALKEDTVETPDITNPSPTTWVERLPDVKGKVKGGVEDIVKGLMGNGLMYYVFDYKIHGVFLTGSVWITICEQSSNYQGIANYEIAVDQGKVRLYFADEKSGYRYIEATPGRPAQVRGWMLHYDPYRIVLEAVDGDATGLMYHIWRK